MHDARKSLLSYIGPGAAAAAAALLAIFAAVAIFALSAPRRETPQPPVLFERYEGEEGGAVYLDIIGLSDAICPNTADRLYYVAEDDIHAFRIVCLTESEAAALEAQRLYWNSPGAEASAAHLVGQSLRIPDSVRESVTAVFGMDEESFRAHFGERCLFSGLPEQPESGKRPVVLPLLLLLLGLGLLALWLVRSLAAARALLRLEDAGALRPAAAELLAPGTQLLRGDRLRMGEHFLFGWRNGLAAAWEDVVWCYGRAPALGKLTLGRVLVIATADGVRHRVLFPASDEKALRALTAALRSHSPSLLLGDSAENRAAWRRACR